MGRWSEAAKNPDIRSKFLAVLVPAVCFAVAGGVLGGWALGPLIGFELGAAVGFVGVGVLELIPVVLILLAIRSFRIG